VRIAFAPPVSCRRRFAAIIIVTAVAAAGALWRLREAPAVRAQNPDLMMPEQAAAKGRELLKEMVAALGGDAYLQVKDISRSGRVASFDSKGALGGYMKFRDFVKYPDKTRVEFGDKRNIIDMFDGEKVWTLDRGGVQQRSTEAREVVTAARKRDYDRLLRLRMNEEGLLIRYAGSEIMDLKRVDLVEIVDQEKIITRIAIVQLTRLPMRVSYISRDPKSGARDEDTVFLASFQNISGIMTPVQRTRHHNGIPVSQTFFSDVQYNTHLPDSFFSKEALDQAWIKLGKK